MRRILTVSFGYPGPTAPSRLLFTHEQAKALRAEGAEIEALDLGSSSPDGRDRVERYEAIPVTRLHLPRSFRAEPGRTARGLYRAERRIRQRVKTGRFDLVLLSFVEHKYAPFIHAFRSGGASIAFTAHGVDVLNGHHGAWIYRQANKSLMRSADHIFAVSPATAELAKPLLPPTPGPKSR